MWMQGHVVERWVKGPTAELGGASRWEEQAGLDCLITKNPPEVGLARTGRFIHHILSEYPPLWVEQQGPGLLLGGCLESESLFAYPEGRRRKWNQLWRLLLSLDDHRLFDIAVYWWRSSHTSVIGNHFRFVCLREEEVRELLSRQERRYGQGRCSPQEQHTEAVVVT